MKIATAIRTAAVAFALSASLTIPLAAQASEPAPGGGSAFGQHVSSMAPEHPREFGAQFGACVSLIARGLPCGHAH